MDRSKFVGGSDVAAIMGMSRWETPLSVWAKKTGQIPQDIEINEAIELGIELEDFVAKKFERKSGKKVRVDNRDFTHAEYPYMKAHIDRWVVGGEILECKTASAYKVKEWDGEEIPDEYLLQVNWYLGIVGHKKGYIAVLIGGQRFQFKEIDFCDLLYEKQVQAVKNFWENYVLTNTPPVAIANDKDTLVEIFPSSRPNVLETITDPDMELAFNQLAIDRLEGNCQIKEIAKEVDDSDNKIRQLIGDNEGLETGQFKATWKSQSRTSVDTKKLKEDGLYEKYAKTTETRVLRVIEKKGKK